MEEFKIVDQSRGPKLLDEYKEEVTEQSQVIPAPDDVMTLLGIKTPSAKVGDDELDRNVILI